MIFEGENTCPFCGCDTKHYDSVSRQVRTKYGKKYYISMERVRCTGCNRLHRVVPNYILPNKLYEKEIIQGVLEGLITPDTLFALDYPCEMTMRRWRSQILQIVL